MRVVIVVALLVFLGGMAWGLKFLVEEPGMQWWSFWGVIFWMVVAAVLAYVLWRVSVRTAARRGDLRRGGRDDAPLAR